MRARTLGLSRGRTLGLTLGVSLGLAVGLGATDSRADDEDPYADVEAPKAPRKWTPPAPKPPAAKVPAVPTLAPKGPAAPPAPQPVVAPPAATPATAPPADGAAKATEVADDYGENEVEGAAPAKPEAKSEAPPQPPPAAALAPAKPSESADVAAGYSWSQRFDPATMPLPVWLAGGAAVLGGATAIVAGSLALHTRGSFDDTNDGSDVSEAESLRARGEALNLATDVALGVAAAGLATTATLFFVLDREPAATARAVPWVGPGVAGVSVIAAF